MSNWPNNFDLGHPNWTARTPSTSRCGWKDFDGVGGYAKDSYHIPPLAWAGAACVVVLLIVAVSHLGAAAGF